MNLVDSSGWIEYFTDGKNAKVFAQPIRVEADLITPTICIYEVFKRVLQEFGEDRALETAGVMTRGVVVELGQREAIEAARLSAQLKLAMADSIILATARSYNAILWTQDVHFKDMEGVRYIARNP